MRALIDDAEPRLGYSASRAEGEERQYVLIRMRIVVIYYRVVDEVILVTNNKLEDKLAAIQPWPLAASMIEAADAASGV